MFLFAAISLGFLGSFHCVGMCGPIALALPVKRTSAFTVFTGSLTYNLGRIISYGFIGLLFGVLGSSVVLAGWQNSLSITLGSLILLLIFIPSVLKNRIRPGFIVPFLEKLKQQIRKQFKNHSWQSLFTIGFLNGFLPCGLVYLGIVGSLATGTAFKGMLFMVFFGLGTFPAMLLVTNAANRITPVMRKRMSKAVPYFVALMAFALILRGLNLDIPYLSPSVKQNNGVIHTNCCHK
ncbi:MAG TPA: sulfite exporter TauE/SafE family protein [Flavobacteriales bacterium]|nr:sulfite exporter TauE/SafE family protein [Flavobacteriales bacterium]